MRRDLADIPGRDADPGRLTDLSAYLEAETEQESTVGGLVLSVGLTNGGDEAFSMVNPFAMVQFQVRDEHGFPVAIPTPPPEMLIHRPGGERWTVDDGPLPVVAVRQNGQSAEPNSLNTDVLDVGANDDYLVSYEIRRIGSGADAGAELPDGSYTVRCTATLIDAEQRQTSRILQSEEIAIRFAKRAP
ncbi:MAG: hypothetical protein ACRDJH_08295 [Thermomicrobiales bacterium]